MADEQTVSDVQFELFLAGLDVDALSPWEKRAYRWHKTAHNTEPYDPNLEAQIAAYKLRKHGKAA